MADKKVKSEPNKFTGKIRLYFQETPEKPDIIVEIRDPEVYACMEILHGLYELEGYQRWQDNPDFVSMYESMWMKAEAYVDRIKKLRKIHKDKWDWDWAV